MGRKTIAILALLVAATITGIGWLSSEPAREAPSENSENTYDWTEIFDGYEAYLDRRISYSTISGVSMEPTFGDGDVILWVEVEPDELRVGDIIIYKHPTKPFGGLIAHRIIEIPITPAGWYRFETKGDNRSESDAETAISAYLVSEDDLKGLVIGVLYS